MKIELPLDGTRATAVRESSEAIFKSRFLLEILLVIAQEDRFYHGQIAELVPKAGGSFVTSVLKRYEEANLIRPIQTEAGQARRYLEKRQPDHPLWTLTPAWVRFLLEDPPAAVAQLVRP